MKYFQTWQDFMRQPENKALKEAKGIHACKQKYIQEQNKMQWNDPVMLTENNGDAGISIADAAAAAAGGGTDFITGNTAQISTVTFPLSLAADFTASIDEDNAYFDVEAYDGSTDFSNNHANSTKTFRFFLVSGSGPMNDRNFAPTIPGNIDGVITASATHIATDAVTAGDNVHITGSILGQFVRAIKDQAATDIVAGFTNTIKPSTLFTAITSSANVLQITNKYRGAATDISIGTGLSTDTTASVAVTTNGDNTFFSEQGALVFDGDALPFTTIPIKDDGLNTTSQPT